MSGIPAEESVALTPRALPDPADAFRTDGAYPPLRSWEVVCAGLTFGALCFFAVYFAWYFWTGALLF
jgi:hypothetical protein